MHAVFPNAATEINPRRRAGSRYRGLAKNHHRLCANFALVNLYLHRKHLAVLG